MLKPDEVGVELELPGLPGARGSPVALADLGRGRGWLMTVAAMSFRYSHARRGAVVAFRGTATRMSSV